MRQLTGATRMCLRAHRQRTWKSLGEYHRAHAGQGQILILNTVCHYLTHSLALQPNSPIRYCLCVPTSSMWWVRSHTTTAVLFDEKATFGPQRVGWRLMPRALFARLSLAITNGPDAEAVLKSVPVMPRTNFKFEFPTPELPEM
jgi:hypothetical protein